MQTKRNTIILAAGKLDYSHLPIGMHQSNATIPVNGKPVIGWILDDLVDKGILKCILVVRVENIKLINLVENVYQDKLEITLVKIKDPISILDSLKSAFIHTDHSFGTRIILGDTLILDSYNFTEKDFIYCAQVDNSENWCIIEIDENDYVYQYFDKQELPGQKFIAAAGYYQFSNTSLLEGSLSKSLLDEKSQLSDMLAEYGAALPIKAVPTTQWFDFGHIDAFVRSKKSLLRPRHFNQMTIDPILNIITKESTFDKKLQDELDWYEKLPNPLKVLTPRIVAWERQNGKIRFSQEYYGYPNLAELFLFGDLDLSTWKSTIDYLLEIHLLFKSYSYQVSFDDYYEVYNNKTEERIKRLKADVSWQNLLDYKEIIWNGNELKNASEEIERNKEAIESLCKTDQCCLIHGDFCFSNILFDVTNQIAKVIDPRGSFGSPGIYGDPRYDIAKLRHSIAGNYDFIISDLFTLHQKDNHFNTRIYTNEVCEQVIEYFDQRIVQLGYHLEEIKLIESLLFLSMIPYHSDFPNRQRMMFLRGLALINQL